MDLRIQGLVGSTVRRSCPGTGSVVRVLSPFLSKPLGGSAGLVDVPVVRHAHNLAVLPHTDGSVAQLNLTAAADRTVLLNDHAKAHSIAEVDSLLRLERVFLVGDPPVLDEATSCGLPFKDAH